MRNIPFRASIGDRLNHDEANIKTWRLNKTPTITKMITLSQNGSPATHCGETRSTTKDTIVMSSTRSRILRCSKLATQLGSFLLRMSAMSAPGGGGHRAGPPPPGAALPFSRQGRSEVCGVEHVVPDQWRDSHPPLTGPWPGRTHRPTPKARSSFWRCASTHARPRRLRVAAPPVHSRTYPGIPASAPLRIHS
jgi:hypothetical protein